MIETITPPLLDDDLELLQDDSETIAGFKTIRFLDERSSQFDEDLVNFVKESFPCARVLVNIRSDTEMQALSRDKALNFEGGEKDHLERLNERMQRVANMFGSQAMLLDSSKWTKNMDSLNQVVKWLGFNENCFFEKLLEFNTKGSGYGHGKQKIVLNPNCRYVANESEGLKFAPV